MFLSRKFIKHELKVRKLSYRKLAVILHVHYNTIYRCVNGKSEPNRAYVLICQYLTGETES
jgi:plasmid maintenance system antidote protein VapI